MSVFACLNGSHLWSEIVDLARRECRGDQVYKPLLVAKGITT